MEFDIIVETVEGNHLLLAEVPNRQYGSMVAEALYEQYKNAPPSALQVRYVWLRDTADPRRPRLMDAWPENHRDRAGHQASIEAWKASPRGVSGEKERQA